MKNRFVHVLASMTAAALVLAAGATLVAQESQDLSSLRFRFPGAVYTMSNASDRNAVLIFDRLRTVASSAPVLYGPVGLAPALAWETRVVWC